MNNPTSLQYDDTEIAIFIKYIQCKNCKSNYTETPPKCSCDKPYDFEEFDLYLNKVQQIKSCNFCGRKNGIKAFPPTSEEPDHTPVFCEQCFMSDECTSDEPMTKSEKAEMWLGTKEYRG